MLIFNTVGLQIRPNEQAITKQCFAPVKHHFILLSLFQGGTSVSGVSPIESNLSEMNNISAGKW